jgi:bla regulator protein blaR1
LSLGAWERKSELARRVHSILLGGKRMGTAQARVLMSVLVLGLLGGSAELARCPQLVSFSRTALPVSVAAQSPSGVGSATGPGYVPVSFHGAGNGLGVAHETLLKASVPVDREVRPVIPVSSTVVKHRRTSRNAVLQRSRQNRAGVQQVRGWVMLTAWDETERRGMVLSESLPGMQERVISISYAAVPTAGGWLVIQL